MITQNEISSLNLSPTKKDFVQIWNELIEVASKITERWDPTSTNESDPGIVLLKVLAGIADKLNYNIDKNILEAYMPTAAQMESMRKLCELVGYDIKYYQSAETKVKISYTGNTSLSEDNDEKLPTSGLALPKFTTITNADKDITFVTTNTIPVLITNDTPWVEVPCIEGQISQCESTNDNNLITLAQLDDEYKYYLPEIQIAENGIFVYNAIANTDSTFADNTPWTRVSNLNTQPAETRVFKFGYDSFEGRPYLAFPADIGSLIGDGLLIYFVRTSGLSGNISPNALEVLELPSSDEWSDYSAEKFEVVNVDATTNGANIENISTAYNNFKKTVGTFDTLVTCRDYMNKIYSLMDASNLPYVSNTLVTDIRNDINKAITLCSCDEYGILYKETPLTSAVPGIASAVTADENPAGSGKYMLTIKSNPVTLTEEPLIDHFDLLLYPFKTFTQVSSSIKEKELVNAYNRSFTYTEQMNREIEASLDDFKTCAHNLTTPAVGDIVAINNYLRLNALIATSTKVSEAEAEAILHNVKVALVNAFNLRNLDFGEEIPFDNILSVIENADSRIKVVSLQEPTLLTTYSVKELSINGATSEEYGIATTSTDRVAGVKYTYKDSSTGDEIEYSTAKDIYNKLVLRNILAGRAPLFDYDETFIPNNSEKPYTATKNIEDVQNEQENSINNSELSDKEKQVLLQALQTKRTNIDNAAKAKRAIHLSEHTDEETGKIDSGEYILYTDSNQPVKGLYNGNLSLRIFTEDVTNMIQNAADNDAIAIASTIKEAVEKIVTDESLSLKPYYILSDSSTNLIKQGFYSVDSRLTLNVTTNNITTIIKNALSSQAVAIKTFMNSLDTAGIYFYKDDDNNFTKGLQGGIVIFSVEETSAATETEPAVLDKKVFERVYKVFENAYEVFETYEPSFNSEGIITIPSNTQARTASINSGIINDVKRVEAVCEIQSSENTFKNIKLDKNEVIKFRAPNLITTKTFPAYVYYRFERGTENLNSLADAADGSTDKNVAGRFAEAIPLIDFINQNDVGTSKFFEKLWTTAGVEFSDELYTFTAEPGDSNNPKISTPGRLAEIFNSAIAVGAEEPLYVLSPDATPDEDGTYSDDQFTSASLFLSVTAFTNALDDHFVKKGNTQLVRFRYYPLTYHTASTWSTCIRELSPTRLPQGNVLWKLSSTSSYPKGKFVLESGKKLIGLDGDSLALGSVGELVYICKYLGLNPDHYALSENSDIELRTGDKLYIHYTPSSTDADGNTTDAEPISIVYEGGDAKNPVILKPSGFSLIDSDAVYKQGTSWKKTDVDFGKHGKQNLLALAPNEQIELRSISKVVLNTTARFYKNFENLELESGNINKEINYELKDGEYIFYTDRNTQEAAYYGSGSVITLTKGAFIPRAKEPIEISEILTQGLHKVPWSDDILLTNDRTVTITEYQYVTLVEGDTLNTLTVDQGAATTGGYVINSTKWIKCLSTEDEPIIYTPAGSETSITLPRIDLSSGPSTSWEVSSFLELATSPGYSQQLRMADFQQGEVKIKNKIEIYNTTSLPATPVLTIEPVTASDPVSFKLSTTVHTASGSFEKTDSDLADEIDDSKMQMKVFKEDSPKFIELSSIEEPLTPISNKVSSLAEVATSNLSNYWTKLEVGSQLSKSGVNPSALNLNFMVPEDTDVFGIFSIYLDVPEDKLGPGSYIPSSGSRVFIDIPKEVGSFNFTTQDTMMSNTIISIYNFKNLSDTKAHSWYSWWPEGTDNTNSNRLYLRAGLNCIRVNKSCNLLIKAEANATGSLLYDNMRLVKGRSTHGLNLKLLNPDATFNSLPEKTEDEKKDKQEAAEIHAKDILDNLAKLDKNHDFYYNVPVENSLAIEFDKNINSFSNPYTLYDINNVNNDFVISKLDVVYLKDGLSIAKSSKY